MPLYLKPGFRVELRTTAGPAIGDRIDMSGSWESTGYANTQAGTLNGTGGSQTVTALTNGVNEVRRLTRLSMLLVGASPPPLAVTIWITNGTLATQVWAGSLVQGAPLVYLEGFGWGERPEPIPAAGLVIPFHEVAYATPVVLDFSWVLRKVIVRPTGNLVLSAINRLRGRALTLEVVGDGTNRTITMPAAWRFYGDRPTLIRANKLGLLGLDCDGSTDADVRGQWSEEV